MLEKVDQLKTLINKYQVDNLSPEEATILQQWLSENEENRKLFEKLTDDNQIESHMRLQASYESPHLWDKVIRKIDDTETPEPGVVQPNRRTRWMLYPAAAILLGVVVYLLIYKFTPRGKPQLTNTPKAPVDTTQPATTRMGSITRADGSILYLNKEGYLDQQGAYAIYKEKNIVKYVNEHSAMGGSDMYNTFTAPRGSIYTVVLPNGTNTMLTPTATMRFGVSPGNLQTVDIKGEVGFKVTKSKTPFMVNIFRANDQYLGTVEVTGTIFNIDASDEEESGKITLLDGKLKVYPAVANANHMQQVSMNTWFKELKPGQQAQLQNGRIEIIDVIDTESVFAWQKGTLRYTDISSKKLMPKLENWYDVEIDYANSVIPDCIHPTVTIYPGMQLKTVLAGLKDKCPQLDIKFKSK